MTTGDAQTLLLSYAREAWVEVAAAPHPLLARRQLGQTLLWLCSLDDTFHNDPGYEVQRNAAPAGEAVNGLRYARNQVVHGADLVQTRQHRLEPHPILLPLGQTFGPVEWRGIPQMPPLKNPNKRRLAQEEAYRVHLAGRAVSVTMEASLNWLEGQII